MFDLDNTSKEKLSEDDQVSLISTSKREAFFEWLSVGNAKKYSPSMCMACLDKISEYAIRKKISSVGVWDITQHSVFQPVYKRLLDEKLLRVTEKSTYKKFNVVGQLYLRFLKEKPWTRKATTTEDIEEERDESLNPINPEDVIAWLVTQPNANGTLYLENVVRSYIRSLRSAPPKLALSFENRDVFSCHTVAELDALWNAFRSASNYKKVNSVTSGSFSAGLAVYRRYLGHLGRGCAEEETHNVSESQKQTVTATSESASLLPKVGYVPEIYEQIVAHNTPKLDESVQTVIIDILDKHFPNGIRLNSIIDTNKLKSFYIEAAGRDISEVVPDIPSMLEDVGIKHDDKVYAVSANGKKELAELFDRLLSEDNRLFYYDEFYDAHADMLQGMHIFSSELLRTILPAIKPYLWYYKNYCQTDRNTTVESEILRCYETVVILSYDQLKDRLPYVPLASIRQVLAQNSDFIWVNTGVYTHVLKIEFDKSESHKVCSQIEAAVSTQGFASIASFDFGASVELNPELSEAAIRNGLFQVYLSDRYEKRGNIVTIKGTVLNSVAVFEGFCRSHNRLTLDELLNYEKEINGDVHSQSLFVAYDNMVRTDRDTFVADSEIQFDVDATDNALDLFVHGDVIPLRAVTSFTSFPYIDGYPWNWFLLESFCRRFSKRFRFQCLSVSSRNVGAIYKKSAGFANYTEILAAAVAVAPIKLNQKEVGDFLFESGYIARRTSFVADVVAQARLLRERRG